jgi:uncharacterized membrane protein YeaQ/YmgE (transglycosylase-associated protein family)
MFPIKYIDNNLVWNKDNEVFAYYELIPYNYSFLSAEQKFIVHDSFRQLIAQSREGKIHALQIATESSIRSMQEQSKKLVTGKLKEVACQKIDEQTEALVSMIGDNQVDYRFFLGFKLMVTEEQLNLKNIKKSAWLTFKEFLHEVNHTLMNDFVSMPNDEINRYMKMEKLLENKISRRFKVRRLEIHDFGYLMEHLYGRDGIAYEDYEYQLPKKKLQKETLIKYYDLIRPTRCVIEESQRYLRLEHEDRESYVSYFTVNAIVGELDFPSSEIFYFQQQQFTFPVDTSMNVEIVENRKALTTEIGMFIPMFSGGFRFGLFILFTVWSIACAIAAFILYYWNREHIFSSVLYSLPVGALFAETIAVFIYFLEHQTFLFQLLMDIIGAVVFTIIFFKKVNYRKMYIVGIVLSTLVFYYIFPW